MDVLVLTLVVLEDDVLLEVEVDEDELTLVDVLVVIVEEDVLLVVVDVLVVVPVLIDVDVVVAVLCVVAVLLEVVVAVLCVVAVLVEDVLIVVVVVVAVVVVSVVVVVVVVVLGHVPQVALHLVCHDFPSTAWLHNSAESSRAQIEGSCSPFEHVAMVVVVVLVWVVVGVVSGQWLHLMGQSTRIESDTSPLFASAHMS